MKRTILVLVLVTISGMLLPWTGNAQRRRGYVFGRPDAFEVRSETHIGCRTQEFSYSSGDIQPCFDLGLSPEFKFYLDGQSVKLNALSHGFIDIPRMASKFVAEKDATTDADDAGQLAALDHGVDGAIGCPQQLRCVIDSEKHWQ